MPAMIGFDVGTGDLVCYGKKTFDISNYFELTVAVRHNIYNCYTKNSDMSDKMKGRLAGIVSIVLSVVVILWVMGIL